MLELNVIGGAEFVLGFQLAGIHNTFEIEGSPINRIRQVMQDPNAGILILDQNSFDVLALHEKELVERSVRPVVVTISASASQDALRKMILKSIGVDLWKE